MVFSRLSLRSVWNGLDFQSLAAAHLPALLTGMGQLYTGLTQMIGGWRWHKMGLPMTQKHVRSFSSIWLQKVPACQNSSLWGPQALWEIHRVKMGAPVFGWVEVLGGTGRAYAMLTPGKGSFTPPCTWTVLRNVVPFYALVVLAPSFCWFWAPYL